MKTTLAVLLVGTLVALGSAASVDTSAYILDTAQSTSVHEGFGKKREEPPVRIAARYIVAPDEAKAFIDIFEKQKDQALKHDGTVAYRLYKTLDDNVTFLFAGIWKSYADLKAHLESESTIAFLKDLAEKRIIFKTTQVIEVAKGGDRERGD
eukprot:jgi/Botrbrau1/8812/Bobra.0335s0002.1